MDDLFPARVHIGSHPYGLDADHHDHTSETIPQPDLTVTDRDNVVGYLWSPDGKSTRTVLYRAPVPFGFTPDC